MELLLKIVIAYFMFVGAIWVHELGHLGRPRMVRWFPFPTAESVDASWQYGGLLVNFVLAFGILLLNSSNVYLNLFGLMNFVHFVIYCFWGSFNKEFNWPQRLWRFVTFDDIPNKLWWVFVPLGIISLYLGGDFYWKIATTFFGG